VIGKLDREPKESEIEESERCLRLRYSSVEIAGEVEVEAEVVIEVE